MIPVVIFLDPMLGSRHLLTETFLHVGLIVLIALIAGGFSEVCFSWLIWGVLVQFEDVHTKATHDHPMILFMHRQIHVYYIMYLCHFHHARHCKLLGFQPRITQSFLPTRHLMVSLGAMFTKLLVLTLLVFTGAGGDETCSTVEPIDLEEELPENLFLIQAFDGVSPEKGKGEILAPNFTDIEFPERDR